MTLNPHVVPDTMRDSRIPGLGTYLRYYLRNSCSTNFPLHSYILNDIIVFYLWVVQFTCKVNDYNYVILKIMTSLYHPDFTEVNTKVSRTRMCTL